MDQHVTAVRTGRRVRRNAGMITGIYANVVTMGERV